MGGGRRGERGISKRFSIGITGPVEGPPSGDMMKEMEQMELDLHGSLGVSGSLRSC